MGISQPWNQSQCPLATVNRQPCYTEAELQQRLRQLLSGKLTPLEIAIYEPAAQRVFLSLVVYSPEELLPQDIGILVGNMGCGSAHRTKPTDRPENLGLSLAITAVMNNSQNPTAVVIGAALLSGINKGYKNVSFGTNQQASCSGDNPGAVVIWIQT